MHLEKRGLDMQSRKDRKYTILVSGASGIVGYGILRSLRARNDCFLIGTTIYPESPANCFADLVEIVPKTEDSRYLDFLKKLIIQHSVDMIIPAIEADMSYWNIHRLELEGLGTTVLLNNPELVTLCLDKWQFYKKLEEHNYRGRILSSLECNYHKFKPPFILKPRKGFGARGVVKVEKEEDYNTFIDQIGSNLMMQEYVGTDEEEFTVSVFFDREFRMHNKELKLLEINPRISSSTSIRCKFGYNESKMAVDYFMDGEEIVQPKISYGKAMRYTEDYIIYDSNNI